MSAGQSVMRSLEHQRESQRQYTFAFVTNEHETPYMVAFEDDRCRLEVTVRDFDRHDVTLESINVDAGPSVPEIKLDPVRHQRWLYQLSQRLSGLYGGIDSVENDDKELYAVLRTRFGQGGSAYFEFTVRNGEAVAVKHFTVDPATRQRRQTRVSLESEVFMRLLDDLAAVAH